MRGELFDSTIPFGEPELLRASSYERYLDELSAGPGTEAGASQRTGLSPSLRADLGGFEALDGLGRSDTVEVVAACIRHSSRVAIHLRCGGHMLPLTIFPQERLAHCPTGGDEWLERHLATLEVLHIEPATLRPPGDAVEALVDTLGLYLPLAPLLWKLALHGPRRELLPQIAGPAVYRASPAIDIAHVPVAGAAREAVTRLRREAVPLTTMATWRTLNRERAARLLNALYLHGGLIVSRSHPQAGR